MVQRFVKDNIESKLFKGKAIILLGARQVGKTTLLKEIAKNKKDVLWINADNIEDRELFSNPSSVRLKSIIGNKKIVIIDDNINPLLVYRYVMLAS